MLNPADQVIVHRFSVLDGAGRLHAVHVVCTRRVADLIPEIVERSGALDDGGEDEPRRGSRADF